MIFISYSSKDYDKASELRASLLEKGLECWMAPESIMPGSDYATEIPNAIEKCTTFIILLSGSSQSSVWVPKELDLALTLEKPIVPIKIDKSTTKASFLFRLTNIQIIDAQENLKNTYLGLESREKPVIREDVSAFSRAFASKPSENAPLSQSCVQNPEPKPQLSAVDGTQAPSYAKKITMSGTTATIEYNDGRCFKGKYVDGQMDYGVFTWPNGDEYTGSFQDNKINGHGKATFADGRTYSGSVTDDKISGSGKITWPNGDSFSGTCKHGFPDGYGRFTHANGENYLCKFTDGKLEKRFDG